MGTIGDNQLTTLGGTGTIQDRLHVTLGGTGTLDDRGGKLGSTGSGSETSDLFSIINDMETLILSQGASFSTDVTMWGDSWIDGNYAGTDPSDDIPNIMETTLVSTTVNNEGVGGERTDEILARTSVASAAQKQHITVFLGGGNDISQNPGSYVYPTVLTNLSLMAFDWESQIPSNNDYLQIQSWNNSHPATKRGLDKQAVIDGLQLIYGARFIENTKLLPSVEDPEGLSESNRTNLLRNIATDTAQYDGTDTAHPSIAYQEKLAVDWTMALLAVDGVTPYVQGGIFTYDQDASASSVVHTPLFIGTASSWEIVAGNDEGLFDINSSTGVITRSSTGTPTNVSEVLRVRANGTNGWYHDTQMRMVKAGSSGFNGTRVGQNGVVTFREVPSVTDFSMVICMKIPTGTTDETNVWGSLQGGFIRSAGSSSTGRYQVNFEDASGTTLLSRSITPTPLGADAEYDWHWMLISRQDAATPTSHILVQYSGGLRTSPIDTNLTGSIAFDDVMCFFDRPGFWTDAERDFRRIWFAPNYIDFSSSTERDRFYNSSTLEPVTLAADGTVNSITPWIYQDFHAAGNYLPSEWVVNNSSIGIHGTTPILDTDTQFDNVT